MSTYLRCKVHYIFLGADTLHIPLILGATAISWGLILSLQADTFITSRSYLTMGNLLPEPYWASLMLFMGAFQLVAAIFNWNWKIQAVSNLIPLAIWLAVSIAVYQSNIISALASAYPFFTFLAYGRFYRCITERENI